MESWSGWAGVALLDGRPEDIPKFMERMKLASLQKRAKAQRRQRELTAQANQLQQTMASADTPAARKVQAAQRRVRHSLPARPPIPRRARPPFMTSPS